MIYKIVRHLAKLSVFFGQVDVVEFGNGLDIYVYGLMQGNITFQIREMVVRVLQGVNKTPLMHCQMQSFPNSLYYQSTKTSYACNSSILYYLYIGCRGKVFDTFFRLRLDVAIATSYGHCRGLLANNACDLSHHSPPFGYACSWTQYARQ